MIDDFVFNLKDLSIWTMIIVRPELAITVPFWSIILSLLIFILKKKEGLSKDSMTLFHDKARPSLCWQYSTFFSIYMFVSCNKSTAEIN